MAQVKSKSKPKPKPKPIPKQKSKQKEKSYNDYYQECIKGKDIPKDALDYFKKAVKRAKKEYEKGIKLVKSALSNFAEKYVVDGKPGLTPLKYFAEKAARRKDFLRNHRNIKVRMILICEMERQIIEKTKGESKISFDHDNAYFHSQTHINLEKTDVKVILSDVKRNFDKIGRLSKKRFRLVFQRSNQF